MGTAQNFGQTHKKLYFDVTWGTTVGAQAFACTAFRTGLTGDRFGALMKAMQACTGGTPQSVMAESECSAWFQCLRTATVSGGVHIGFNVYFAAPTVGKITTGQLPATGHFAALPADLVGMVAGQSAVFGTVGTARNFSVVVAKQQATTAAVSGVLYVQRQHSIEV
jgi:hypothetical protein